MAESAEWPSDAERGLTEAPDGFNTLEPPKISIRELEEPLRSVVRYLQNMRKCTNWLRCLNADLLDGHHASDFVLAANASSGDVVGPASATDTAIVLFDGTTGKLIKNSPVTVDGSGNVSGVGTVDGRDLAADGGKLDNIEDNATADQTGAEIKALYEAEADTNAFTDAEKTKLAGIETAATADQSDAEIETAYNNQVSVVSQAEAEAGTSTTVRRWTAERVAQAIAALASGGTGDVVGPASSTDNAIARFDSTTGKLIQDSSAFLDDSGYITAPRFGPIGDSDTYMYSPSANRLAFVIGGLEAARATPNGFAVLARTAAQIAALGGQTGALVYDTTNNRMCIWNGSAYVPLQVRDALLDAIAALTTAADQMIYSTGSDTVAMTSLTSFARGLLDDSDAATARATLGVDAGLTVVADITASTTTSCAANSAYNYNNSNAGDADVQRFDLPAASGTTVGDVVIIQVEQNAGGSSVLVNPDTDYFLYSDGTKNTTDIELSGDPTYIDSFYKFTSNGRNGWVVCCYYNAIPA